MSRLRYRTKRPRFWARQFALDSTPAQDTFDVIFGVALPIMCLLIDPVVLKGGIFGPPLLEDFQLVTYLAGGVEMGLLLAWRTFRKQVSAFSGVFATAFLAGSLFSTLIGFAILPYSLVGLMVLIGLLGFTPFFTAFVFLRNGVRAMKAQFNHSVSGHLIVTAMLGGVMVIGLPVLASIAIEKVISTSVDAIVFGNATDARRAADRLKWVRFIPDKYRSQIAQAYLREFDPDKKAVLKNLYKEITGEELERRHLMLVD